MHTHNVIPALFMSSFEYILAEPHRLTNKPYEYSPFNRIFSHTTQQSVHYVKDNVLHPYNIPLGGPYTNNAWDDIG